MMKRHLVRVVVVMVLAAVPLCRGLIVARAGEGSRGGLESDERLQGKISVTCRSAPLPKMLQLAADGQAVGLQLGRGVSPDAKVTAVVKDVPLHQFMEWVAALYQAQWRRTQQGYVLEGLDRTEFERELVRLGDPDWFSHSVGAACYEEQRQVAWEVWRGLSPEQQAQARNKGIPVTELGLPHRERLMGVAVRLSGEDELCTLRKAMPDVLGRAVLVVREGRVGEKRHVDARLTFSGQTIVELPSVE